MSNKRKLDFKEILDEEYLKKQKKESFVVYKTIDNKEISISKDLLTRYKYFEILKTYDYQDSKIFNSDNNYYIEEKTLSKTIEYVKNVLEKKDFYNNVPDREIVKDLIVFCDKYRFKDILTSVKTYIFNYYTNVIDVDEDLYMFCIENHNFTGIEQDLLRKKFLGTRKNINVDKLTQNETKILFEILFNKYKQNFNNVRM